MFGVNAYGVVVRGGGLYEMDFWFIGVQIEGQFIFANNEGNTTVNLHAFDGTTFCEVRGTAVFAPNRPGLKIPPGVFAYPNGQSCPTVARRPKQTSTASAEQRWQLRNVARYAPCFIKRRRLRGFSITLIRMAVDIGESLSIRVDHLEARF